MLHLEGMSDTPSELREVVNRSSEAILISNNLPSTSSVFTHDVLGYMNGDGISWSSNPLYQHDKDDASPWTHQMLAIWRPLLPHHPLLMRGTTKVIWVLMMTMSH